MVDCEGLQRAMDDGTLGVKLGALLSATIPPRELEESRGWTEWHERGYNAVQLRLGLALNPSLDLEVRGQQGQSLLDKACGRGDLEAVKLLVEAGAEYKTAVNRDGENALFLAASRGNMDTARWLKSQGVTWQRSYDPALAAQLALAQRSRLKAEPDLSWLRCQAPVGIDWEGVVRAGRLAQLGRAGSHFAVHDALAAGADINTRLLDGRTPLMFSTSRYKFELLVSEGADVMARDVRGMTVLHWACRCGRRWVMRRAISAEGEALLNAVDDNGMTALMWAIRAGDPEVAEWLLRDGRCDWSIEDKAGKTASDWAREQDWIEVAEILEGKVKLD